MWDIFEGPFQVEGSSGHRELIPSPILPHSALTGAVSAGAHVPPDHLRRSLKSLFPREPDSPLGVEEREESKALPGYLA